jgi:predicted Zn-dependent protease
MRERTVARPLVAVLGVAALVAVTAGGLDVMADRHAADAAAAGRRGDTAGAVLAATEAVDRRPDEVRLHLLLARTLVAADRPTKRAVAAVDDALRISPDDPIARRERARLLVQLAASTHLPADVAAARDDAAGLVARDRTNAASWMLAGAAARLAADAPAAEAAFERAEDLSPRDPTPSIELALLYLDTGRRDEAAAAADRAVARAPGDARAQDVRAHVDEAN